MTGINRATPTYCFYKQNREFEENRIITRFERDRAGPIKFMRTFEFQLKLPKYYLGQQSVCAGCRDE